MNAVYCVFGQKTDFRETLARALSKYGGVLVGTKIPTTLPPHVQVTYIISNEPHKDAHLRLNKVDLVTIFHFKTLPQLPHAHFIAVDESLNEDHVAQVIAKISRSFDFSKNHIFLSEGSSLNVDRNTVLHYLPQEKFTEAHKATSVPSLFQVTPQKHVKPAQPTRYKTRSSLVWLLSLFFFVSVLPFMLTLISGSLFYVYASSVLRMESAHSNILARLAITSSDASIAMTSVLPQNRFFQAYEVSSSMADFISQATVLLIETNNLVSEATESESLGFLTRQAPRIDKLSRDAQRLLARRDDIVIIERLYPKITVVRDLERYLSSSSTLISRLGFLTGVEKPITYALFFQNNMELRPTGGFLGSFALMKVEKGSVTGTEFLDVYDADGKLPGYVTPPVPLREYLGEAQWWLRDSNWDPSFPDSARRALWFLEKSIDASPGVVVAVNLEVLTSILKITGPIQVPDFNDTLNAENAYEKIQNEVHENFFPGSRKKAQYLTAVYEGLRARLMNLSGGEKIALARALLSSIDSRDIQLYSNDTHVEEGFLRARVGGEIEAGSTGFVEANLGVNKANQFISRKGEVSVVREGSFVTVRQKLTIKNNASTHDDTTRYRVYVRGLAPHDSTLISASIVERGIERSVTLTDEEVGERRERGLFIEVQAGQEKSINIAWKAAVNSFGRGESGNRMLIVRKQSGVPSYPILIGSLTEVGENQYNTELSKDITIEI